MIPGSSTTLHHMMANLDYCWMILFAKERRTENALRDDDTRFHIIPTHYTGLLQPCDVGINKSLKDQLKEAASN